MLTFFFGGYAVASEFTHMLTEEPLMSSETASTLVLSIQFGWWVLVLFFGSYLFYRDKLQTSRLFSRKVEPKTSKAGLTVAAVGKYEVAQRQDVNTSSR